MPLLAQMEPFRPYVESVMGFVFLTLIFVLLVWFLDRPTRSLAVRLVLWGILTTVAALGYAMLGVPTVAMLAPALTKIGFLLILGGVTVSVLTSCCGPFVTTREADHV